MKVGKSILKRKPYSKINTRHFSPSGLSYDGEGKLSIISNVEIKEVAIDLSKQGLVTLVKDLSDNNSKLIIWQKMSGSNTGMSKQDKWQKESASKWLKSYLSDKGTQLDNTYVINKQDVFFLKKVFIKGWSGKSGKGGASTRTFNNEDKDIIDIITTFPPETPTKDMIKLLDAAKKLI